MQTSYLSLASFLIGALGIGWGVQSSSNEGLSGLTRDQREILSHFSIEYLPDGAGGLNKTIRVTGVNLQIVNGLGATNGTGEYSTASQFAANGTGNLIVGYDESVRSTQPGAPLKLKTGSHNLVVGPFHLYTSWGGAAVGWEHGLEAPGGVLLGGSNNSLSTDPFGAVVGGQRSWARGGTVVGALDSLAEGSGSVFGGAYSYASGDSATVVGGLSGQARGRHSTVSGGLGNAASGPYATVSGGASNTALGRESVVSGGINNRAPGRSATVSGGASNTASGRESVVSGGRRNRARGRYATVSGGLSNTAAGNESVVSGGRSRTAPGKFDWAAGALSEDE